MDRAEKAAAFFTDGCNCAQAVFTAFADELGLDEELAKRLACGLGGGVGRMREVCGAVSAAAMVIGMRQGPDKAQVYPSDQDFCAAFKSTCGSIICRDLLQDVEATTGGAPEVRTPDYYARRPCLKLVKFAASLLEKRS